MFSSFARFSVFVNLMCPPTHPVFLFMSVCALALIIPIPHPAPHTPLLHHLSHCKNEHTNAHDTSTHQHSHAAQVSDSGAVRGDLAAAHSHQVHGLAALLLRSLHLLRLCLLCHRAAECSAGHGGGVAACDGRGGRECCGCGRCCRCGYCQRNSSSSSSSSIRRSSSNIRCRRRRCSAGGLLGMGAGPSTSHFGIFVRVPQLCVPYLYRHETAHGTSHEQGTRVCNRCTCWLCIRCVYPVFVYLL